MSSASTESHSLWREILKSTGRITRSNSAHFYALSVLFLLPIFFTLVVYPCFHIALFHPDNDFTSFTQFQSNLPLSNFEIVLPLVYTLFLVLFFLCAVSTITHSAVDSFYDRPVSLVSSIKSIRSSFFPVLSTLILSHTIFISIATVFAMFFIFIVLIVQSLGLIELKFDSNHFFFLFNVWSIVVVPILIWLQVNWSLASVIAVVESKWGFESLRRSAYLVKGKRWVALLMLLFYGIVMGLMVICGSIYLVLVGAAKGNQWRSLAVILQTAQSSVMGFLMMNQFLVGNVVLYMYCNGEILPLPLEIGDKFDGAGEYVALPLDDEKNQGNV